MRILTWPGPLPRPLCLNPDRSCCSAPVSRLRPRFADAVVSSAFQFSSGVSRGPFGSCHPGRFSLVITHLRSAGRRTPTAAKHTSSRGPSLRASTRPRGQIRAFATCRLPTAGAARPPRAEAIRANLERALARAGIPIGGVTFHTLRHTALSRMIAAGHSDHTVMAISGHSSTRMLERHVHPTQELKISALETGASLVQASTLSTPRAHDGSVAARERRDLQNYVRTVGGRHEARTRDLRVANAALSQLS